MLLKTGDKIHVISRRLFEGDLRRHLAGEVQQVSDNGAIVEGYTFIWAPGRNEWKRRPEKRTQLISLRDAGNIITLFPAETDIERIQYVMSPENRLVITDGKKFTLDINEFSSNR